MLHPGAAQTLTFVLANVKPPALVLEVGCGDGVLAKLLIDAGFSVTAIDKNKEAIEKSGKNGIPAIEVDFLEYAPNIAFDVVLFSRSLHHIETPPNAVKHACTMLKDNGMILLEDFCAELMDQASALWFFGLKSVLAANGKPQKGYGPKLDDGQVPANPVDVWYAHHFGKHSLSDSAQMRRAIECCLQIAEEHHVPYLYRYFLDDVEPRQGEQILRWEQALCDAGALLPLGLRIVAHKQS
jgi:SAM-dependent methyltransferase